MLWAGDYSFGLAENVKAVVSLEELLNGFQAMRYGLVWSGLVWSGLVWSGLVWSGLVKSVPFSAIFVKSFLADFCMIIPHDRLAHSVVLGK